VIVPRDARRGANGVSVLILAVPEPTDTPIPSRAR
jgi:hypothetical protein